MWRTCRGPLTLAALVFAGGCSANNGPKYPDVTSFCNGRATAECSSAVLLACAAPNSATCIAKRQQVCVASQPSGTVYNASAAESCVNHVSDAYNDAKLTQAELGAVNIACTPVFDGPGGKDASCQSDSGCKQSASLRCVLRPASMQGTCQVPQPVSGGGSCSAADAQCSSGFHCGSTAHCDADGAMSDPCTSQTPCGPTLQCSSGGVCVSKTPDGSSCMVDVECANGICNKAMSAATGLCVPEVIIATNEPFCVDSR